MEFVKPLLIWSNLKQNICPKCNKMFDEKSFEKKQGYINCRCGFLISLQRFSEIVTSQITTAIEERLQKEFGKQI